jgi:hypothetical protein
MTAATRPRVAVIGHIEWLTHGIGPMPAPGEITLSGPSGAGRKASAALVAGCANFRFFTALGDAVGDAAGPT